MPKFPYFEEGEKEEFMKKPKRACEYLRMDLKDCLLESDCVRKDKKKPSECLKLGPHPSVPNKCRALWYSLFECKRSLLDMRTRFRGRKE